MKAPTLDASSYACLPGKRAVRSSRIGVAPINARMPRERLERLQLQRLRTTVARVLERVVLGVPGLGSNYQLVVERPSTLDELTVVCELASSDTDVDALRPRVARAVREAIGLAVNVELVPPGGLPRSEGKAVRVVDRRASQMS